MAAVKRHPSLLMLAIATAAVVLTATGGGRSITAQDGAKYDVQVPDGLSLSEVRGYEGWQVVSIGATDALVAVVVANPTAIAAYQAGIPGNGQPFPDGSKLVKIHWTAKKSADAPFPVNIPDTLKDVGIMVKDGKRFAQGGGWGYGVFGYVPASDRFTAVGSGTQCGVACHTRVIARDYVFTAFAKR